MRLYKFLPACLLAGLLLLTCKVDFSASMEEYLEEVAAGRVISVLVDETEVSDGEVIDFGTQKVGTESDPVTVVIENMGVEDMTVNTIGLDTGGIGGNPYILDLGDITLPLTLAPDELISLDIIFEPSLTGDVSEGGHEGDIPAVVTVGSSDGVYSSFTLNLDGCGAMGGISVTQGSTTLTSGASTWYFDVTSAGSTSDMAEFTITNNGDSDLTLSGLTAAATTAGFFTVTKGFTDGTSLASGASTTFSAAFSPSAEGAYTCDITISSDDTDEGSFTFTLRGGTDVPRMLGDVSLWLDATDSSTITYSDVDGDGTNYVTAWADKLDSSIYARPSTSSNEVETAADAHERRLPKYTASSINGLPAVTFEGSQSTSQQTSSGSSDFYTGDILYIPSTLLDYVQGMTVFTVFQPNGSIVNSDKYVLSGSYSPLVRIRPTYFYAGVSNPDSQSFYYCNYDSVPASGTPYCVTNLFDNEITTIEGSYENWVNNSSPDTSENAFSNTEGIRLNTVTIGNYPWGRSDTSAYSRYNYFGFNGDIAEILIFSRSLTDDEIDEVHSYLNDKYAIW